LMKGIEHNILRGGHHKATLLAIASIYSKIFAAGDGEHI
jgi:hypothetical protein